jgi:hypothetical protein
MAAVGSLVISSRLYIAIASADFETSVIWGSSINRITAVSHNIGYARYSSQIGCIPAMLNSTDNVTKMVNSGVVNIGDAISEQQRQTNGDY